jgi:hypothetical protein
MFLNREVTTMKTFRFPVQGSNRNSRDNEKFAIRFFNTAGVASVAIVLFLVGMHQPKESTAAVHEAAMASEAASSLRVEYFPAQFPNKAQDASLSEHVQAF